jgi:hypothetical protein
LFKTFIYLSGSLIKLKMTPINTSRTIVFDTLAEALASNRVMGYQEVAVIKGDNTRFKRGDGVRYSGNPASFVGSTFAQLPWTYTEGAASKTPFQTFAQNATGTITAANLLKKYITSTSAAAVTMTLPTATLLGTALSATRGTEMDFTVDNYAGANIVTVAVGTGITVPAAVITGADTLTVAAGTIGRFKIIFKTATAALLIRIF